MQSQYFCHNGEFYNIVEKVITHHNRAFCYGDALFESIHCLGTMPQFIENHWNRLIQGMHLLKMDARNEVTQKFLHEHIEKLLNKNRIFKGARIRFMVYRNEGGLYTPDQSSISWLMESKILEIEKYELNTRGLTVDIFDGVHKPVNVLSNLKTNNALVYVLAGIFGKENKLDECFILNQYGRIIESISSNVFIVTGNTVVTPPLTEGCIAGTMRHTLLSLIPRAGYKVEERGILEKHLLEADEIFITNAIQGIRWIGAYRDKRYFNFVSRKLITLLNVAGFST
jgi:branched-subunit amino acid aminotransferase/4-amino-4-deoxychorismate lyase